MQVNIYNKNLFSIRGIIKDHLETTQYLLPFLILNILIYGNEDDKKDIFIEILEVLNALESCLKKF